MEKDFFNGVSPFQTTRWTSSSQEGEVSTEFLCGENFKIFGKFDSQNKINYQYTISASDNFYKISVYFRALIIDYNINDQNEQNYLLTQVNNLTFQSLIYMETLEKLGNLCKFVILSFFDTLKIFF